MLNQNQAQYVDPEKLDIPEEGQINVCVNPADNSMWGRLSDGRVIPLGTNGTKSFMLYRTEDGFFEQINNTGVDFDITLGADYVEIAPSDGEEIMTIENLNIKGWFRDEEALDTFNINVEFFGTNDKIRIKFFSVVDQANTGNIGAVFFGHLQMDIIDTVPST